MINENQVICGWGRNSYAKVNIFEPFSEEQIKEKIQDARKQSLITRGLGRAYGDSAQLDKETVIFLKNFNSVKIDKNKNEMTAQGGISFDEILSIIIPQGYFLPVSPGTRYVTVGGAIAADVHGKNHHKDGTFGKNVKRLLLMDGKGELLELGQHDKSEENRSKFWATVGGMGMTGVILEATFSLIPISSSFISVETSRHENLDDLMDKMVIADKSHRYSVAWVDSLNKNFRGVLTSGNHAHENLLPSKSKNKALYYDIKSFGKTPNLFPVGLLNQLTVKAFNEAWYRKSPKFKEGELQNIGKYFYPLDGIKDWNLIYGKQGFIQYQFVIPDKASYMVRYTLEALRKLPASCFLTVLKRFGNVNPSPLSFPIPGWTLAIDIPANTPKLYEELNRLDSKIVSEGGRIYLAKDSRQSSETFRKSYPRLMEWLKTKDILDPKNIFMSDSFKRLLY